MDSCIFIENISKKYGRNTVLENISFSIQQGEIFGLIGADGAGKTTLIKILNTLLRSNGGNGYVCGFNIDTEYSKIRKIVGYMPGRFSLYGDLSVQENIQFFARVFNTSLQENYDLIKDIYQLLEPFKKRKAADLSGGMKQKLALCCALIHKPQVLFLDEPTTGVDPVSRNEFWTNLGIVSKSGITTVVSTPYMDEAALCDRIALMQNGKILKIDTPKEVIAAYPNDIIIIKFSENANKHMKKLRSMKLIKSVYSFGDSIHISCRKSENNAVVNSLKSEFSSDIKSINSANPVIEDCFLHYMQRANETGNFS